MAHVTFIHGIANKPPAGALLGLWLRALAAGGGPDLAAAGVTSAMVYWADLFYERPIEESLVQENLAVLEAAGAEPVDLSWRERGRPGERAWTAELGDKLQAALAAQEVVVASSPASSASPRGEVAREREESVLLPWFARERLLETLLRDAHHYLWNVAGVEDEIRRRTVAALAQGAGQPGPHVVVAHGMGAVIAYDCLKRVESAPAVDALVTLGSPLGLDAIRKGLQPGWSRHDGFPGERVRGSWTNVYDRLDPVTGFNPRCAEDFKRDGRPVVDDVHDPSYGRWRHAIHKYLGGPLLRAGLSALLGLPA
jgi:hypothetical protein